jgi:hypothetical protein
MMCKESIVKLLTEELSSVYCQTCDPSDIESKWDVEKKVEVEVLEPYSNCEGCHRKAMNWGISKTFAESLADKILLT